MGRGAYKKAIEARAYAAFVACGLRREAFGVSFRNTIENKTS